MKYVIVFVMGAQANPYSILPGTMFEYDRADSLEEAQRKVKAFNSSGGSLIILPYYEVEKDTV